MSHTPRFACTLAFALALAAATRVAHAVPGSTPVAASGARCTANVVHPLSVHVTALDAVAHGAPLRLRVTATSHVGIDNAVARLVSAGGATAQSAAVVSLGTLLPGRAATSVFTLALPATGNRTYVQFQVTGQGPNGPLTRGACYNALPDGPLETGRVVTTPQGGRVYEVAARRIDR